MEDVISYYYRGGSTFQSEFWRAAPEHAKARLAKRAVFSEYLRKLGELKAKGILHHGPSYAFSPHTWQIVDAELGYGSFEATSA
jgi:hypothetical protein